MMIGDICRRLRGRATLSAGPGRGVPHSWLSDIAPGERIGGRDMLIQFTPELRPRWPISALEFEQVRALFDDARRGIEFAGATAEAGRRLLTAIGAAQGATRLLALPRADDGAVAHAARAARRCRRAAPVPGQQSRSSGEDRDRHPLHRRQRGARPIRLNQISALCGMEASAFSRFFKKQTGHAFARYVNHTRVHARLRACSPIPTCRSPTSASRSASAMSPNFNRQFIRICGRSPSAYRRDARRLSTVRRSGTGIEVRL